MSTTVHLNGPSTPQSNALEKVFSFKISIEMSDRTKRLAKAVAVVFLLLAGIAGVFASSMFAPALSLAAFFALRLTSAAAIGVALYHMVIKHPAETQASRA